MTEYNKVVYDGQTLIDLTQDDVTASDVRQGVYFHSADGVRSQGTLQSMSKNIWYAECSTASSTASKEATSTSGDFVLEVGNMVRVKMSNADDVHPSTLSVDGCTATTIKYMNNYISSKRWQAGEIVDFVYDGDYFIMSDGGVASTSYYGNTILNDSVSSTSTTQSATPSAVKQAYDLASFSLRLSDIVVEEYTYNFPNVASGNTMIWTETVTKSGYYPIGVVGWRIARSTLVAYSARITDVASGSCGLELSARAVGTANASTAYMYVLWIKES